VVSAITRLVAVVLLACPGVCAAQDFWVTRTDSLADEDVLDAFPIGNVVFVYRNTALPSADKAVRDLSKIISVDRAGVHGKPSDEDHALIDSMLGFPHTPHLRQLSAIDWGESGFIWEVTWNLYPSTGGSTGIPFQFRAHVNGDGSLIVPERFLCDHVDIPGLEEPVFSVLAFGDLDFEEQGATIIHGDQALSLATSAVRMLFKEDSKEGQPANLRFYDQSVIDLRVGTKNNGQFEIKKVWAVNFIPSNLSGDDIHRADELTVWVTTDGFVSQLTRDRWEGKTRRAKH
jgi:hypothetical protein